MSGGLQVHGANLTSISGWLTQLTTQVDVTTRMSLSGTGSSQVESAATHADQWLRGASATAIRDIAVWATSLGDVATVLGDADTAIGASAPTITPASTPGMRAV